MKYILTLESHNLKSKIKNKFFKWLYNQVEEVLKQRLSDNSPKDTKRKFEELKIWFTNIWQIEITNSVKERMDDAFEDKNMEDYEFFKEKYDVITGNIDFDKRYIQKFDLSSYGFKSFKRNYIIDYVFSPNRNIQEYKLPLRLNQKQAYGLSEQWHKSLKAKGLKIKEKGNILIRYKNGFYWVDLETSECDQEGDLMGHCGTTSAETLISLRRFNEKTGKVSAHVTVATSKDRGVLFNSIYQIKGKGNKKPNEKYHDYIYDLLTSKYFGDGLELIDEYNSNEDFHVFDLKDKEKRERLATVMYYNHGDFNSLMYELYHGDIELNISDDNVVEWIESLFILDINFIKRSSLHYFITEISASYEIPEEIKTRLGVEYDYKNDYHPYFKLDGFDKIRLIEESPINDHFLIMDKKDIRIKYLPDYVTEYLKEEFYMDEKEIHEILSHDLTIDELFESLYWIRDDDEWGLSKKYGGSIFINENNISFEGDRFGENELDRIIELIEIDSQLEHQLEYFSFEFYKKLIELKR